MAKVTAQPIVITSSTSIPNENHFEILGVVMGVSVRSKSQFGNMLTRLRSLAGGRIVGYQRMVKTSRDEALREMASSAEALGATHVIAFRFDSSEIKPSDDDAMVEITAYGTAIRVLKVETDPSPAL